MRKLILGTLCCCAITGCYNEGVIPGIAAGSWFNHDRRTAKTIIDDQAITVKANIAIAKNKNLWKNSHVSTLSYNNSILLVGQTANKAYKDQIEKIVQHVGGVGIIYNQISVGCPIALSVRANDTWITTQVKARIVANRDLGINRVKVITEDGVVYLMGALTQDEEKTAINIARCVPCVKKVITALERQTSVEGTPPPPPPMQSSCDQPYKYGCD